MTFRILFSGVRIVASLAALFLIWFAFVAAFDIPPYLLPSPLKVLETLVIEHARFMDAAASTFSNAIVGGTIGILLGMIIGAACAFSTRTKWLVEPYLTIFQSFPREAFFPIMVVWLGFGDLPKIVNASLLALFPMAVITLDALLNTRSDYLKLMTTWRASKWQVFVHCRVPAGVPAILGGIRVAFPLALIGAVLGEFLGGSDGLGHIIVSSGSMFRIDRSFAAIVVLAFGGTSMVLAMDWLKNTFLKNYFRS